MWVSINQAEEEKEVGIYAIGGFLAVSEELMILWDRPYFSRLWCIFELAAFRKCNPQGKITLKPLFVETCVAVGLVFVYLLNFHAAGPSTPLAGLIDFHWSYAWLWPWPSPTTCATFCTRDVNSSMIYATLTWHMWTVVATLTEISFMQALKHGMGVLPLLLSMWKDHWPMSLRNLFQSLGFPEHIGLWQ